jgi:hypothetical protein
LCIDLYFRRGDGYMRVCEVCKYKSAPPSEFAQLVENMSRFFPKVFYCSKLQVVRVYDSDSLAKLFDCEFYEPVV